VGTYNGTNALIYVNGSVSVVAGATTTGGTDFSLGDIGLGIYHSTTYYTFDGLLDEVIFFTNALSASQVTDLYNSGNGLVGATDPGGNMLLVSTNFSVPTQPDFGQLLLHVREVSNLVVNTDIKGYISRDAGTNNQEITLSDIGFTGGSTNVHRYFGTNVFTGAGSNLQIRVESLNNLEGHIEGWGIMYE